MASAHANEIWNLESVGRKMSKVSVVIPCYNLGQYLDEAVESVLAQTFRDFEIIIVDDGSTDPFSKALLSSYCKPRTRVMITANQGLPSARNNGIGLSRGEYICCLDADDKYHPEFLAKTVRRLEEDADGTLGFVTTGVRTFGEAEAVINSLEFDPWHEAVSNEIHVASLFRRECWELVGGYNPNMDGGYEDWNFWISIVAAGYGWANIKEPLFFYRVKPHSMIKDSDKNRVELYRQIIRNNKQFFSEHYENILTRFQEILTKEQQSGAQLFKEHIKLIIDYQIMDQKYGVLDEEYRTLHEEHHRLCQYKSVRLNEELRKYPIVHNILSCCYNIFEKLINISKKTLLILG